MTPDLKGIRERMEKALAAIDEDTIAYALLTSDVPDLVREVERKDAEIAKLNAEALTFEFGIAQAALTLDKYKADYRQFLTPEQHASLTFALKTLDDLLPPKTAHADAVSMSSAPSRDGSPTRNPWHNETCASRERGNDCDCFGSSPESPT